MELNRLFVLIKLFPRASRLPFLAGSIIPIGLGTALAYAEAGVVIHARLFLTMLGMACAHLSVNLFNDYFDHRYGVDTAHPPRPLAGGSQVIQEGLETAEEYLGQALFMGALAAGVAVVLALQAGPAVLLFAVPGAFLGYFYSARPLVLSWRGLGELSTGICFGPLAVGGAYYVQLGYLSPSAALLSLVPGALITALLFVNQYPDYRQDRRVGKITLVVRFGPRRSLPFLYLLLVVGFLPLLTGLQARLYPLPAAAVLAALAGVIPAASAAYILFMQNEPAGDNKPGRLMLLSYTLTHSILLLAILIL
jgi:1,4-dihydroxy-2-naphthoate polyprenyltransferase